MRRRPPHALLLAIALVATLLTACGPSSGHLEVLGLAAAPQQTIDEKTARISMRMAVEGGTTVAAFDELSGEGVLDLVGRRGDITYSVGGQSVRTLIDGAVVYQSFPALEAQFGKKWLKLDLGKLAENAGIAGGASLFQSQNNDASMGLDYLRSLGDDVTEVGSEKVRDVETTHYRGVVDMARAAREATGTQRKAIEQIKEQFGVASIPVDVWIDASGRVRRMRQTIDYRNAKSTPQIPADSLPREMTVDVEFFDFGVPFSFTAPPPEEVFDGSQLLDNLPRSSDPVDPDDFDPDDFDPDDSDPDDSDSSRDDEEAPNPAGDALTRRLLRTVPPGYSLDSADDSDVGPLDIEEAGDNDEEDDGRAALESAGFVAGYLQSWEGPPGRGPSDDDDYSVNGIIVLLYQFRSSEGARTYGSRLLRQASEDLPGSFEVGGIPGARGLASGEDDPTTKAVVMGRGEYLVAVVVIGDDAATPDLVTELAQQQYRLLAD